LKWLIAVGRDHISFRENKGGSKDLKEERGKGAPTPQKNAKFLT